jgi:hypothetical protein
MHTTETIDRLFLELSQFTNATTARELAYRTALERIRDDVLTDSEPREIARDALKRVQYV